MRKYLNYSKRIEKVEKISTNERGIGLIYVIILIAILTIIVGLLGPYLFVRETHRQKDVETLERIKAIRTAILGNPEVISKGLRSNFGYVEDMGGLPPILEYLVLMSNPTPNPFPVNWNQTLWTIHSTGIGYGWRGPYIDPTYTGNYEYQAFRDAWGTRFQYIDNGGNTIINPAAVSFPVFIRSAGQDRTFGTADDINENTHPELCRINEDDVRAILRGYTYCENGTTIQRGNINVYWPSLALSGTVTISSGIYSSSTTGPCPYQPAQTCYYFETPRIPIGIRKTTIDTYVNQFVVINGGGTLHDGSTGRMRWNFRGGSCTCIVYVDGSRTNYRYGPGPCSGWRRDVVQIQIRNTCSSPVQITSIRINYSTTPVSYYETVLFSINRILEQGYGWYYTCPGGALPGGQSGITYTFNSISTFYTLGINAWWIGISCLSSPSFTIPANGTAWLSFGRFKDSSGECANISNVPFTIYLSDGSVLTVP